MSIEMLPPPTTTPTPEGSPDHPADGRSRRSPSELLTRAWQGPASQERWHRPALLALLSATAFLYLWGLGSSGWANSFYSAAAQAGSESWQALFFGSSDAANSITVDKPPMSLWIMGLSVRVFGLSSWAILVPQALMGVASVGLLYATVRRTVGLAGAGLLAGALLAVTPVAMLMFRFNNPDALLVLLMVGAAAATVRAIESSRSAYQPSRALRWLALAGSLVGFAFLTKMLQAFLVVPGLGLAYLLMSGASWGRRVGHLAAALGALIISAGWWIAIVALWPASSRPYIGGSQHNSILELTLGYNGFGRLSGDETGSVGGGGGGWGSTGWLRMLGSEVGGQVGWLLPTSLLLLVAGTWIARRERLAGPMAGLVVWGGWLLVTAATFSFMQGIFHAYYTVALAPAIAAVVAIGATLLWQRRDRWPAGVALSVALAVASVTSFVLLGRSPDFVPWLRWLVVALGLTSALMLLAARHVEPPIQLVIAAVALATVLAGPTSYSLETASTPHTGSIPSAGPTVAGSFGPGGGGPPASGGAPGRGGFPGGQPGTLPGGTQGANGFGGPPPGGTFTGGGLGGGGGLLSGSTPSAELTRLLETDASDYTWVAATIGANNASGYQLATQLPVMPIGGFNGSDPSPTLAQFKAYVAAGRIHYFIASGGGGLAPGGDGSTTITSWVTSTFAATAVDGVTLYDVSSGAQ